MADACATSCFGPECPLQIKFVRQEKIIQVLMTRVERTAGLQNSDFGLFRYAAVLEEQVRRRTAELQVALQERRDAEARFEFLAHHDPLTGLPNRAQFNAVLNNLFATSEPGDALVALLCVDLDRFKSVNDGLGHQVGDVLLQHVAKRIRETVRDSDFVARIGGDEFVLVQTVGVQLEITASLAARVIKRLSQPFRVNGHCIAIGASIGIAVAPGDGTDAETLLRHGDAALYRAKAEGRGGFCFFEAGMDALLLQRREMEGELLKAVAAGEFRLAFQPLFRDASSRDVAGFEVLLRWAHPVRGIIPPMQFIPLAEETGLIIPLGQWILETACTEAVSWPIPYAIAINVSPRQVTESDFVSMVADVLNRTGLSPRRLEIEITETLLITDGEAASQVLQRLCDLGVRIVLDDFGTGYSSLSYLQRFPFSRVKIDKSFIDELTVSPKARSIVSAILELSHQLQLEVTAEGVETREQLELLKQHRCDQFQGFLLARPIPQTQVRDFILHGIGDRSELQPASIGD